MNLENDYPEIKDRLRDENGVLRKFINIFLNGKDIRLAAGENTEVMDNDEISILPAIAGGARIKKHLDLIFPQGLIKEPVIWMVTKEFDLCFNIRRAKVTRMTGEMVLEFEGEQDQINGAIKYLEDKGIQVKPITHDIIE